MNSKQNMFFPDKTDTKYFLCPMEISTEFGKVLKLFMYVVQLGFPPYCSDLHTTFSPIQILVAISLCH
jgi:hypothetical protein